MNQFGARVRRIVTILMIIIAVNVIIIIARVLTAIFDYEIL